MTNPEDLVVRALDLSAGQHTPGGSLRIIHGDEHGLGPISVLLSENPPGGGAPEHRHAVTEIYCLYEGRGVYNIGGVEVAAGPGDVVIVPPSTWHSFRAEGDLPLRHIAVLQSQHMDLEMPAS
jgi:mannose-6-phosphate isomerase-like protein (cupin superfamily)